MNAKWGIIAAGLMLVVAAVGMGVYELQGVPVRTGTETTCSDAGHVGDKCVSALTDVKTLMVPKWEMSKYAVEQKQVVCEACKARIAEAKRKVAEEAARQRREAERLRREAEKQARIAELKSSVIARIGMSCYAPIGWNYDSNRVDEFTYPGQYDDQKRPGDPVLLSLSAVNTTCAPISGLRFRIEGAKKALELDKPEGSQPSDVYGKLWRDWKALISSHGVGITALDPVNDSHYQRGSHFFWPGPAEDWQRFRLKTNVAPGSDVRITGIMIIEGQEVRLNTVVIHIMH